MWKKTKGSLIDSYSKASEFAEEIREKGFETKIRRGGPRGLKFFVKYREINEG